MPCLARSPKKYHEEKSCSTYLHRYLGTKCTTTDISTYYAMIAGFNYLYCPKQGRCGLVRKVRSCTPIFFNRKKEKWGFCAPTF